MRFPAVMAVMLVATVGCSDGGAGVTTTLDPRPVAPGAAFTWDGMPVPPAPEVPDGPLAAEVVEDLETVTGHLRLTMSPEPVARLGGAGDARVAWVIADLLRFVQHGSAADAAATAFETLTGTELTGPVAWRQATDWLIAWDLPAPPDYLEWKRALFLQVEPDWEPFFADEGAAIDWRWVSWGGVFADDRPVDRAHLPCLGCIPALVDPGSTDAAAGDWYPDAGVVFGVVVDGDARAYPRHIMEFHELVTETVGGRRVSVPYCTLCGSAQAYFTDDLPDGGTVELRTSGLLYRSNKIMFDLHTWSMVDTFTGRAVSGPLREAGTSLEMVSVRTTTWGEWKAQYPNTRIVARDGGIGRDYPADPLEGRDALGPVFPIGGVDQRLPAQTRCSA